MGKENEAWGLVFFVRRKAWGADGKGELLPPRTAHMKRIRPDIPATSR